MNKEEWFPLIDEQGNTIGKAPRRECHNGSKLLHPVVHLHIINNDGELYLQKRSTNKDIQPGKWDTAVGGHIDYGETIEEALAREVREELGITHSDTCAYLYLRIGSGTRDGKHILYGIYRKNANRSSRNRRRKVLDIFRNT